MQLDVTHFISSVDVFCDCSNREAQEFVEKFEGALGKGKGRKLYAFKVLMTKVIGSFCNNLSYDNTNFIMRMVWWK